jgi:hypothetical protein
MGRRRHSSQKRSAKSPRMSRAARLARREGKWVPPLERRSRRQLAELEIPPVPAVPMRRGRGAS